MFPLEWKAPTGEISRGYREDGYFPEAFVNLLALLGWNPGTEQEIFSIDELVKLFSLERVIKSGARFNPDKAKWFNQQYIKHKPNDELAQLYQLILNEKGISKPDEYVAAVCGLAKERATFVSDFWDLSSYFFVAPTAYDEKVVKKFWKEETPAWMLKVAEILESIEPFTQEAAEHAIHDWIKSNELNMGQVMNAFRLCVVGASMGPSMFEIAALLGKEEIAGRIKKAVEILR